MIRRVGLAMVLVSTLAVVLFGLLFKTPGCVLNDGRGHLLCYSDVEALYLSHDLDARTPFLDPCPANASGVCDEYPVLTMVAMKAAAGVGAGLPGFFAVAVAILAVAAAATAAVLWRLGGSRALGFSLAPALLLFGLMNWDLLAVLLATTATAAFLHRRDGAAGVLIGLGAATKLYPALLLLPFILDRFRSGDRRAALRMAGAAALVWVAVNLPVVLAAPQRWSSFYRLSASRLADVDSLWSVVCEPFRAPGALHCGWSPRVLNVLAALAFVASAALVWRVKRRRQPDVAAWTFAFPLLTLFVLTGKVYTPQFSLWLIPWLVLTVRPTRFLVALGIADVAVYGTRFLWLASHVAPAALTAAPHAPRWLFHAALLARAAVLIAAIRAWIRSTEDPERVPVRPDEQRAAPVPSRDAAA